MNTAGLPPAGWYTDPQSPSQRRYWDGEAWTSSTAPGATPPPTVPVASAAPVGPGPVPTPAVPPGPSYGTGWSAQPGGSTSWTTSPPTGRNAAYYERAFAQLDAGGSKVVWNWAAFLLGAFWYLFRGMWLKALGIVTLVLISGGSLGLPLWIYAGLMGTYDCYLLQRRGTQGW